MHRDLGDVEVVHELELIACHVLHNKQYLNVLLILSREINDACILQTPDQTEL